MTPEQVRQIVHDELQGLLSGSDRFTFHKKVEFLDGRNILIGAGTGTRIGTATSQKISVYGVTPIIQQSLISAPSSAGGSYDQTTAATWVTAISALRAAIKNFGITA